MFLSTLSSVPHKTIVEKVFIPLSLSQKFALVRLWLWFVQMSARSYLKSQLIRQNKAGCNCCVADKLEHSLFRPAPAESLVSGCSPDPQHSLPHSTGSNDSLGVKFYNSSANSGEVHQSLLTVPQIHLQHQSTAFHSTGPSLLYPLQYAQVRTS